MSQEVDIVLQDVRGNSDLFTDIDPEYNYCIEGHKEISSFIELLKEQQEKGHTHVYLESTGYEDYVPEIDFHSVEWRKETIEEAKERIMLENGRHRSDERDSRKRDLAEYKRLKEKFETKPKV